MTKTKRIPQIGDVVTGTYDGVEFLGRVTTHGRNLFCVDLDGPLTLAPCRRYPQGRVVTDVVVNVRKAKLMVVS